MTCKESDWKLLRKKLPLWQEAYMDQLLKEYEEILHKDTNPSERYWELEKKIKADRRSPGVCVTDLRRSTFILTMRELLVNRVITADDLSEFSDECREQLRDLMNQQ